MSIIIFNFNDNLKNPDYEHIKNFAKIQLARHVAELSSKPCKPGLYILFFICTDSVNKQIYVMKLSEKFSFPLSLPRPALCKIAMPSVLNKFGRLGR